MLYPVFRIPTTLVREHQGPVTHPTDNRLRIDRPHQGICAEFCFALFLPNRSSQTWVPVTKCDVNCREDYSTKCTYPVVLTRRLPVTAVVLLRGQSVSIEITSQTISYLARDFFCMPVRVLGYAEIKLGWKAYQPKYEVHLYPRTTGDNSIHRN